MTEAHFIGGPWNGEYKRVDGSRRELFVALPTEVDPGFIEPFNMPLTTLLCEVGVYKLEAFRTGAGLSGYQHLVYLYQGTEAEIADAKKDARRRRLSMAFGVAWKSLYDNDRDAYWANDKDLKEVKGILDKALA